jgi:pyruvate,orthophosphate dikinase
MFMGERLAIVQQIILNEDPEVRDPALERLRAQQTEDFEGLLEAMDGLPVIIRLLDPPLHEFLPSRLELERERRQRAEKGQAPDDRIAELERAVAKWEETNPMLGLRGVRLGLLVPELYRIQVQAALQAMKRRRQAGGDPHLEIMVPLVSTAEELRRVRSTIEAEIADVFPDEAVEVPVGTMIELPRAALLAGEIAGVADFFSFGTNDLTQTTYGLSRDDADRSFLPFFLEQGIYPSNPFQTMDEHGVGRLVEMGTAAGKEANPSLEVGVCGEHGGDPASIALCHRMGLDYVSASPPRIPVARLAAAQAALGGGDSAGSV